MWGLGAHLEYYYNAAPGSFGVLPRMEDLLTITAGEMELAPEKYLSELEFGLPVMDKQILIYEVLVYTAKDTRIVLHTLVLSSATIAFMASDRLGTPLAGVSFPLRHF